MNPKSFSPRAPDRLESSVICDVCLIVIQRRSYFCNSASDHVQACSRSVEKMSQVRANQAFMVKSPHPLLPRQHPRQLARRPACTSNSRSGYLGARSGKVIVPTGPKSTLGSSAPLAGPLRAQTRALARRRTGENDHQRSCRVQT
jgi:hypothetical protein